MAALSSCRFHFDVSNNADPGVYMQAIISEQTAIIKVEYAAALGTALSDIPQVDVRDIEVRANRELLELIPDRDRFILRRTLEEGERVSISADCGKMGKIKGSSVIPRDIVLKKASMTSENMMGVIVNTIEVTMDRQPLEDEYICVSVVRDTMVRVQPQVLESKGNFTFMLSLDPIAGRDIEAPVIAMNRNGSINDSRAQTGTLTIIVPGKAFKDRRCTLMNTDMSQLIPPRPGSGQTTPGESEQPKYEFRYEVTAQAVSEEFYRYCLASSKSRTDFLGQMGLAPAQFAWSNVDGGFGVIAGRARGLTIDYPEDMFIKKQQKPSSEN